MTILCFSTHLNSADAVEKWLEFVNELASLTKLRIVLYTPFVADSNRIKCRLTDDLIKVGSLEEEEELINDQISRPAVQSLSYAGVRLYLNKIGEKNSEEWIEKYYNIFSNVLKKFDVDRVCLSVDEPYNSPLYPVLELLCQSQNIKTSLLKAPAWRIGIFDDLRRSSRAMQKTYQRKLAIGITSEESVRVSEFCTNYSQFISSESVRRSAYIKRNRASNPLKRVIEAIKRKRLLHFDELTQSSNYFLFLPNKLNSHRQILQAPFFNDNAKLVEHIALSLPKGSILAIQDHPHMLRGSIDYKMIKVARSYSNCVYLDPLKKTTVELISGANAIITVASSVVMEALVQTKPVIMFGQNPELVNVEPPIVDKVDSLEQLPRILKEIRLDYQRRKRIETYLYAFLNHTYCRSDISSTKWGDIEQYVDKVQLFKNYARIYAEFIKIPDS